MSDKYEDFEAFKKFVNERRVDEELKPMDDEALWECLEILDNFAKNWAKKEQPHE